MRFRGSNYQVFEVPERPGMTVLDALLFVHDNLDDTLAFRYSCRGAVCGSCGMLINRVPRLACRTQTLIAASAGTIAPEAFGRRSPRTGTRSGRKCWWSLSPTWRGRRT